MINRTESSVLVDLSKYIEVRLFDDRPHIRGRRITVAIIAYNARTNGWTVTESAHNFGLSEEQVLAALLYYKEHATEIDAQEKREIERFNDAYQQQHSS